MSYKSPIEVIQKEMTVQFENNVYQAVRQYGVTVDKEELIKAIQYDRHQYEKGYQDGIDDAVKHGYWKHKQLDNFRKYSVACSCCEAEYFGNYDAYNEPDEFVFCPHCGARMDGE